MSAPGKSQWAHVGRDGRDRDPCCDGLKSGEREVLGVVQPQLLKGDEATRHIIAVLSPQ